MLPITIPATMAAYLSWRNGQRQEESARIAEASRAKLISKVDENTQITQCGFQAIATGAIDLTKIKEAK